MIAFSPVLLALAAVVNALPQQETQLTSTTSTTGTPIGAKQTDILAPSIPSLPPPPEASSYPRNGRLNAPQPAPYTPSGGLGTNGSEPNYQVKSDFDFESIVSLVPFKCQANAESVLGARSLSRVLRAGPLQLRSEALFG